MRALILTAIAITPLLLGPGCAPGTAAIVKQGAIDFALCEAQTALIPSLSGLGAQLDRGDWKAWGAQALGSALGAAAVCGLRSLATAQRADGAAIKPSDGARIQSLAERCERGACETAEERAGWLLWQEIRAGRVRVAPSGAG